MPPRDDGRTKRGKAALTARLFHARRREKLPTFPSRRGSLPASGDRSRNALPRFRLRASDFLRRQKVTKDRLKDPWSLRIPFPSRPAPCLPLFSALREPTRLSPARCRPWAGEGPAAPDGEAPRAGSRRSVGNRIRDVSEFAVDGGGKPPPYMLRFRRSVAGVGAVHRRAATWGRPYGKSGPAPTQKIPNS